MLRSTAAWPLVDRRAVCIDCGDLLDGEDLLDQATDKAQGSQVKQLGRAEASLHWVPNGIRSLWLENPTPNTDQEKPGEQTRPKHLHSAWAHTQKEEGRLDSRFPNSKMQARSLDFH